MTTFLSGARSGQPGPLRRLLARATANRPPAFVVPGPELLDVYGLDVEAAGLRLVSTPRHATILLLVGSIPPGLATAASVVYAQMPRPRAILALGADSVPSLPEPDVSVGATQAALAIAVAHLPGLFERGAWDPAPTPPPPSERQEQPADAPTAPEGQPPAEEAGGAMAEEGDAPGMDHARMGGMPDRPMEGMDHAGMAGMQHGGMDHGSMAGMDHGSMAGMDHGSMEGMDHGSMGGGFMSMVMMTRDLPRSADGLPMEWVEAPFGPLFTGLPGGLALTFTLDGDTVAGAEVAPGVVSRGLPATWLGPADALPARLAELDPLTPVAYQVLAMRALEAAVTRGPDRPERRRRVAALERERVASHLLWLTRLGFLLGDRWLLRRAGALQRHIREAGDVSAFAAAREPMRALVRGIRHRPLLGRRLTGVGGLETGDVAGATGPVARAAGLSTDARAVDADYQDTRFAPSIGQGGDALQRLLVRLAEMERSLDLALAAGTLAPPSCHSGGAASGVGTAEIETPRGTATLVVELQEGRVVSAALSTPSQRHLALIKPVAEGHELADALLGVASLDLSPWEIDR